MTVYIYANPGQIVQLTVQVRNQSGERQDSPNVPTLDFAYNPSLEEMNGFPVEMTKLETGLYTAALSIPTGSAGLGTYIVSASWQHPSTLIDQYELFMVHVVYPFGIVSFST